MIDLDMLRLKGPLGVQPGFVDLNEGHGTFSTAGNPREPLRAYNAVLMFTALVLQTLYTLLDDHEYQIRDRL